MVITRLSYVLDDDYPTINWNRHSSMADLWLEVDERHKAGLPIAELLSRISYRLRLNRRWPQIDCVSMVPGLGLSWRAKKVFESLGVPGMQFLEFTINDEPFFHFYTDRCIDCLDRATSKLKFFRPSGRVMEVVRYAFIEGRLRVCDVFTIPELSDGMFFWSQETFVTEQARAAIRRAG